MGMSLNDHIMTVLKSFEGVEGVRGAAAIVLHEDGRFHFVYPDHRDPLEFVRAVEDFAMAFYEPEDIDEPEELWLLIDELRGK